MHTPTHARTRTHTRAHTRRPSRASARALATTRTHAARAHTLVAAPSARLPFEIGSLPLVLRHCSRGLFITGKLYERLFFSPKGARRLPFLPANIRARPMPACPRMLTHACCTCAHGSDLLSCAWLVRGLLRALCVRWVTYRMSHGAEHAPWCARGHEVCITHAPCSTATPLRSGDHPREVTLGGGAALDALDGSSYEWMRASGSTQFAIRQVI